jgi:ubiquinone/menaquinone biosynthesis C-methylase UbiE
VNNKAAALRRESSESVLQLAQKANIKLEVKPWDFLSDIAKNSARAWFVKRAEERGIPWDASVEDLQAQQANLDHLYTAIIDPSIDYPAYYTQPFHGYDEGNLNWKAAHELWAATSSMCLSYYDGMSWQDSQEKYRGAARDHIVDYWQTATSSDGTAASPQSLLDLGCSGGLSTYEMTRAFPGVEATGVDLSPHFLSVAKHTYPDLNFVHAKGEEMSFADSTFDVVTINFLLHELPLATTREVLCEARRVLRPGGILSVLDLDARRLLELPPLRRWAFQVTEPWCKDGEYFSFAAKTELEKLGFRNVQYTQNDPVNAIVLATK